MSDSRNTNTVFGRDVVDLPKLVREFSRVIGCSHCVDHGFDKVLRDTDFNLPWPGYIGSNYQTTRVLLVGQNPGVSPDRFNEQDRKMAEALLRLAQTGSVEAWDALNCIHETIIPTWPVCRHFPLVESGLALRDIAYTNAVRCRTERNTAPLRRVVAACTSSHLAGWLDWLEPRLVVCIGKWAHDAIAPLVRARGISSTFVNRRRDLSSKLREENREAVAALVRQVTG